MTIQEVRLRNGGATEFSTDAIAALLTTFPGDDAAVDAVVQWGHLLAVGGDYAAHQQVEALVAQAQPQNQAEVRQTMANVQDAVTAWQATYAMDWQVIYWADLTQGWSPQRYVGR